MLSRHLARLYEVSPKALVQAVKRNRHRFKAAVAVNIVVMRAFVRLRGARERQ